MENTTIANINCPPVESIIIQNPCNLTELGIFISSIILSSSAFLTSLLGQIQKSKCKEINGCGVNCIRELEP